MPFNGRTHGSFGLDPELFVVKRGSNKATSIHKLDTFKPAKVKDYNSNPIASYSKSDGFAFEFTTDPSTCRDYISPALAAGLKRFYDDYPDYKLSAAPAMELTQASTRGNTPEGVCDYGCIPDRNAYSLEEKTAPLEGYVDQFRFTGGHIHMSLPGFPKATTGTGHQIPMKPGSGYMNETYKNLDSETQMLLAAATTAWLDLHLGIPFVALLGETNGAGEAMRRTYYGQAGSHRVKPYGVEYRVLSGQVLSSPFVLTWALGTIRRALDSTEFRTLTANLHKNSATKSSQQDALNSFMVALDKLMHFDRIRSIIDNHDVEAARIATATHTLHGQQYNTAFFASVLKADEQKVALQHDMFKAWDLGQPIRNHQYAGIGTLMRVNNYTMKRIPRSRIRAPHSQFVKVMAKPRWG